VIFKGIEIVCPSCRGDLVEVSAGGDTLRCGACGSEYPIVFGIPDLRLFPDPYISIEDDRAKARRLASHFDELSFREFVEHYYSTTDVVPPQHAKLYTRGLVAGEARSAAFLSEMESDAPRSGALLEIGCGTGPLLVAARSRYSSSVGVDVALRWLVVARKRLAEAGADVPVICACAEALPFRDERFDRIVFESALEHVRVQSDALAEAHRVARPGARLLISTPNRYSLGPDPQVGIWAGGYLPSSVTAAIVTRQGGIPPKRNLLSTGSLRSLLRSARFTDPSLSVPGVPDAQKALFPPFVRALISAYSATRRSRAGNWLLRRIGPLLTAVAEKPSRAPDQR
jgi:SAM-dependent methyltransferase